MRSYIWEKKVTTKMPVLVLQPSAEICCVRSQEKLQLSDLSENGLKVISEKTNKLQVSFLPREPQKPWANPDPNLKP